MASGVPHTAIFIHNDGKLSSETITTPYTPSATQTLIRVKYSAINPADIRHAYMGLYKTASVAGYEWTGTVITPGERSNFATGQELFGTSMPGFDGKPRANSSGAHQNFLLAEPAMTWPIPIDLDPKQAAALPIGLQTAADALFNILGFGFEPAQLAGLPPKDKAILIWGGASTCGHAAIQIARVAGFNPIFVTASANNHTVLGELGATQCFDYHDSDVVEQIRAAVEQTGKQLTTVFDAVGAGLGVFDPPPPKPLDMAKSTPSQARKCLSDVPEDQLRLCAVLPVAHDPAWKFCLGMRLEGSETLGLSQHPSWPGRVESFMQWFLENPKTLRSPNVTVVSGIEESMRQIRRSFEGSLSMEKVIIDHSPNNGLVLK